jgi:predicted nucleic acid-binding protein
VTLVLDSGGVTALAGQRARLAELRRRGQWPPEVPAIVLVEVLSGDHRRDFPTDRLLALCQVLPVTDDLAREGARLRTATGRAATINATDAVVAALALRRPQPVVLTSDPDDLRALVAGQPLPVRIARA